MKSPSSTLKKVIAQISMLVVIVGCAAEPMITQETTTANVANSPAGPNTTTQTEAPAVTDNNTPTCAQPDSTNAARCAEMEAAILSATVRLVLKIYAPNADGTFQMEDSSIGHATILEGRYLLTHNHFGLSLADFQDGRKRTLTLHRPDGEVILQDAPFGAFTVVTAAAETLVFDFGDYGGQGLFAALGLASIETNPTAATQLRPGMEVAQVDWNGATAHVDWVRVLSVTETEGTPAVVLDNFVEQGASGGGIFYEGQHLGNNWFRSTEEGANGEILGQYSTAA